MLTTINLNLSVEDVNKVIMALAKLPYEIVGDLLPAIRDQATKQVEAAEKSNIKVKGKNNGTRT